MGNYMKAEIESIGTYHLVLSIGYHLNLFKTFYIPSIFRNLVSLPKLDICRINFTLGHGCFSLYKNSKLAGSSILVDGSYKLKLNDKFTESVRTMHHNIRIKHGILNESFAYLWHKNFGHISKERLERLVKNEILHNIDFINLDLCVNCIKGKRTKHNKRIKTIRST